MQDFEYTDCPEPAFFLVPIQDQFHEDAQILAQIDLSLIEMDNLQVEIRHHRLVVFGERRDCYQDPNCPVQFSGHFERNFDLPAETDLKAVTAHYENGVLRIFVPAERREAAKPLHWMNRFNLLWDKLLSHPPRH